MPVKRSSQAARDPFRPIEVQQHGQVGKIAGSILIASRIPAGEMFAHSLGEAHALQQPLEARIASHVIIEYRVHFEDVNVGAHLSKFASRTARARS